MFLHNVYIHFSYLRIDNTVVLTVIFTSNDVAIYYDSTMSFLFTEIKILNSSSTVCIKAMTIAQLLFVLFIDTVLKKTLRCI